MPRISEFLGIAIYMYYKDHHPPHFHAIYGEFKAQISINDFRIISGRLPPKALSLTIEWASLHQKELRLNWELTNNNQKPKKIPPLI